MVLLPRARLTVAVLLGLAGGLALPLPCGAADGASVGTTGDDRNVMLGDVLDLIPWGADTRTLSAAGEAARDAVPSAAQPTFDQVHQQVVDRTNELCDELESAPQERVDALKADYTSFAKEEEAQLDRIKTEEQALDAMRRTLDQDIASIDDWEHMPASDQRIADAEAALKAARTEKEKADFARKELIRTNAELIRQRSAVVDAGRRVRAANAEVARLNEVLAQIDSGEVDVSAVGGIGGAIAGRQTRTNIVEAIAQAQADRSRALAEAGEALYLASAPADMAALNARLGPLEDKWQIYQAELAGAQARVEAAAKAETEALEAREAARKAVRDDSSERLVKLQADIKKREADYAARLDGLFVDKAAAVLSYQLYSSVWDCIGQRQAELDEQKDEAPAMVADMPDERVYVAGTITDTCYGPAGAGDPVEVNWGFKYDPAWWGGINLAIDPDRTVHIRRIADLLAIDNNGKTFDIGEGVIGTDGSFRVETTDPTAGTHYRATGYGQGVEDPDHPPIVLEGRLWPDPAAPQGWAGKGTGVKSYRYVDMPNYIWIHEGELCTINWIVP